jgi:hypothetical protein
LEESTTVPIKVFVVAVLGVLILAILFSFRLILVIKAEE